MLVAHLLRQRQRRRCAPENLPSAAGWLTAAVWWLTKTCPRHSGSKHCGPIGVANAFVSSRTVGIPLLAGRIPLADIPMR